MDSDAQIYVQIPAYRDSELAPTLRSLFAEAAEPGRLRVRVLWQFGPEDTIPHDLEALPNLEIDRVPSAESEGCNWARCRLQSAWQGERYTLLLDSHHRFVRGWDRLTIGMLEALRDRGVEKPLLTGYLPNYYPALEPTGRMQHPFKIYPYARDEGVLTRLTSYPIRDWTELESPVAAEFLSLHFVLVDGRFNHDVPFDPVIYFFGDEVLTSVRAFAAGYELFHPHRVIGWHAYDRTERTPHWDDHPDWATRHRASLEQMRRIYGGRSTGGSTPYPTRTVADYERQTGVQLVAW